MSTCHQDVLHFYVGITRDVHCNMHDSLFAAPPWLWAIQLTLKGTTSLIPKPSGAGKGLRTKLYIVEPLGQNYCMKAVITLLVGWFPWQLCLIICYQAATHCGLLVVVSVVGGDTVEKRSPSSSSRNPSDFTCVFVGSGCFSFGLWGQESRVQLTWGHIHNDHMTVTWRLHMTVTLYLTQHFSKS